MSTACSVDDAEKGVFDKHEHSVTVTLSVAASISQSDDSHGADGAKAVKSPTPAPTPPPSKNPGPRQASLWIRTQLWLNTYRLVRRRKFFTFVICLNITGIALAITGQWQYPQHYSGACVLGNLLVAILMRNELFGRFLYLFVNTLFAKVEIMHILIRHLR
ncbi:hypothetical protein C0991_011719 [Blastosporella zonata]|nr:hypothetical protein C0991_011719 [Blastosporella zonata]